MKVLAVSTWYPTPAAPVVGVFVRKDVQALAKDHEVTLLHLAPPAAYASAPREERDGAVRVIRVPLQLSRPDHLLAAARAVANHLRDADLLHTMAFSTLIPLGLSRPKVPWVHTEHWSGISVPSSFSPAGPYIIPAIAQLLRRPDVVAPVCEFLARPVRRYRRGPVIVVPCIVDRPEIISPRPAPGPKLRMVSVGGLTPGKDPVLAVETVAELRRRGTAASLTWVGDGPLRAAVADRARILGVSEHVLLTGPLPTHDVFAHLAEADVFVLPTRNENFCVSAAEALANGRPVVVGAFGGQTEYVTESVGRLVQARTPAAYADAVLDVRTHLGGVTAAELGADVRARFSEGAVRADYRSVYDEAAAHFTGGRKGRP